MRDGRKLRLLVADDHPIFRAGLRNLLDQQPDMQVVAEAADGVQAVEGYRREHPDVCLMDLRMPGLDGAQATAAIRREDPQACVLILTTYDGDEDVHRAVAAGARGYLLKDTFAEGLLDAIRAAHAGERLFDEALVARAGHAGAPSLSPRERAVLDLIARGLSNKEIQETLSMAEGTLKNHLRRIFEKLAVADRTRAVIVGIKHGLIRLP
jgi:DNA-binding NarL/FixJ family response regulator